MRDGPLKLGDSDFWGDYRRTEAEVRQWIDDEDFRGLLLDVPSVVSVGARSAVPVLGWFVRTLREDLQIDPVRQMLVVAVDQDTNQVRTGLALDRGKTPAPSEPPSGFDPGEGVTLDMFDFDLRRAVNLPWRASRQQVAVLLADKLSNAGTVTLVDQSYQDPAVREFLEQRRRERAGLPAPVWPIATSARYPTYAEEEESPAVPDENGIVLAMVPGGALRGSFRLPYLVEDCVPKNAPDGDGSSVGYDDATAVLEITVVMTESRVAGPWVFPLRVPVFDAVDRDDRSTAVVGYFNVELPALPRMPDRPGTYYLYAFRGAYRSGAAILERR